MSSEFDWSALRRWPDVQAGLQAWDATDRLLLDVAIERSAGVRQITVVGDRYGALTLGLRAELGADVDIVVVPNSATGTAALDANGARLGLSGWRQVTGPDAFVGSDLVLGQLPRTLAELRELAAWTAAAGPTVFVVLGGRVKHMTLRQTEILRDHFRVVQPQLARHKSRLLIATEPLASGPSAAGCTSAVDAELGVTVCAYPGVFGGTRVDVGTRYLVSFLDRIVEDGPPGATALDLGCGTGVLATVLGRARADWRVVATDDSLAAVRSTRATAAANGVDVEVVHADAGMGLPDGSVDVLVCNPPFHVGSAVHAGAATKVFRGAARVLRPGGVMWTVFNSHLTHPAALRSLIGPTTVVGRSAKFTVTRTVRSS